jgi:hypothetical protein
VSKREREARLEWVRIGDMKVSPRAQRKFRPSHAEHIGAKLDLEAIGYPVVNRENGHLWVIDGQHRIAALRLNGFGDDDLIQCECFEGLSEAQQAEMFLLRDERRQVGPFDKFRIGLVAGRETETQIDRIVRGAGLKISRDESDGCIAAVSALRFVHGLSPRTLGETLDFLQAAFGDDRSAYSAENLKGAGLVVQRYGATFSDEQVRRVGVLGTIKLRRRAESLKLKTGHTMPNCVAAALVDAMNGGRGGSKLESWWK